MVWLLLFHFIQGQEALLIMIDRFLIVSIIRKDRMNDMGQEIWGMKKARTGNRGYEKDEDRKSGIWKRRKAPKDTKLLQEFSLEYSGIEWAKKNGI